MIIILRANSPRKKTSPITEGGVFMKTRFEFNVKGLDIKVDEEYLYMNLFEDRCMIKVSKADIKTSIIYLICFIRNYKRIG